MKDPFKFKNLKFSKSSVYKRENTIYKEPTITVTIPLKFTPKRFSLDLDYSNNFFIYALKAKLALFESFGMVPKSSNFHFYKISKKMDKVNFRKRKNIYFNLCYSTTFKNSYSSFIHMFKFLLYIKTFLEKRYFKKFLFIHFFSPKVNFLTIYIKNFHWLLSFLQNKEFLQDNYMFKINIDFRESDPDFFQNFLEIIEEKFNN